MSASRITLAFAFAFAFAFAGCRQSEPEPEPDAAPSRPRPTRTHKPPAPQRGLQCNEYSCEGSWVSAADVEALAEHPKRDTLHIQFDDETSDSGFATIVELPWVRRVSISSLSSVSDLSPIAKLTELRTLHARGRGIVDLSPLAGLRALESLDVYNQFADIDLAPLRNVTTLKRFEANLTKLHNVDALASSTGLESVTLLAAGVTDVSFLAKLERLETVSLQGNEIADISALARLPALRDINVTNLQIDETAFEGFVSIPGWTHVQISGTKIRSLSFLAPAVGLLALSAENCAEVRSIAPLRGARKLRQLRLSGTSVVDLSPLAKTDLRELWLYDTPVRDVRPLRHLPLWGLGLSGTKVTDVSPLLELPDMRDTLLLPAATSDEQLAALKAKHGQARVTRDAPPTLADVVSRKPPSE